MPDLPPLNKSRMELCRASLVLCSSNTINTFVVFRVDAAALSESSVDGAFVPVQAAERPDAF